MFSKCRNNIGPGNNGCKGKQFIPFAQIFQPKLISAMEKDMELRKKGDMRDLNLMKLLFANIGAIEKQVVFDHRVKSLPSPYPPPEWIAEAYSYKREGFNRKMAATSIDTSTAAQFFG